MSTKLEQIKRELSTHHRDKKFLELYYVNTRLEKSLNTYYKELEQSLGYLDNRVPENILKKL